MGVSRYVAISICRVSLEQGTNAGNNSHTGSTPAITAVYSNASASVDDRVAGLLQLGVDVA